MLPLEGTKVLFDHRQIFIEQTVLYRNELRIANTFLSCISLNSYLAFLGRTL